MRKTKDDGESRCVWTHKTYFEFSSSLLPVSWDTTWHLFSATHMRCDSEINIMIQESESLLSSLLTVIQLRDVRRRDTSTPFQPCSFLCLRNAYNNPPKKKLFTVLEPYLPENVRCTCCINRDTVKLKSSYCLSSNFSLLCGHVNVHN